MVPEKIPHRLSSIIVVGLILSTGALAANAVLTSVDTLVPILKGEPWAGGRALSERTVALTVAVTTQDDGGFEGVATANGYHFRLNPCTPRELPLAGVTVEVHEVAQPGGEPGVLVTTGQTDETGHVVFDLEPGKYELSARNGTQGPSQPRLVRLHDDTLAWFEWPYDRSIHILRSRHEANASNHQANEALHFRYGHIRDGLWTVYPRNTFVVSGEAQPLSIIFSGEVRLEHNVTARVEKATEGRTDQASWETTTTTPSSIHFRLTPGTYHINLTWSNGTSAETTIGFQGQSLVEATATAEGPALVHREGRPPCT